MIKKIDIKDYENDIKEEKYDNIYDDLISKSINLVKEIEKIKIIEAQIDSIDETVFRNISFYFKQNFCQFKGIVGLMEKLIDYLYYEDIIEIPEETKIKRIITMYNSSIDELHTYKNIKKELEEKKLENIIEERKEKFIKLFKEMLEYKNKKYDNNWDIIKFINKIDQYYNFYHENLCSLENALSGNLVQFDLESNYIQVNNIERIMHIDGIYEYIHDYGYIDVAYLYRDFELEDGQTYEDLYNLEIEKFNKLFKKMLEFIGENNFEKNVDLEEKIKEKYPFYGNALRDMHSHDLHPTYIQILDAMEETYENILKDYHNYEINLKKYKDYESKLYDDEEF